MPKLHLRTFQKKAYIDGDGTVVFPNAVELNEGIIPTGGTLTYEASGTDLQTQVTANATAVTALQSSGHAHVESYVYVDVARAGESYVEDGSEVSPYRSLNTAVAARLEDSDTDTVIFKLAPGDYVGTIRRPRLIKSLRYGVLVSKIAELWGLARGIQRLVRSSIFATSWV